MKPSRVVPVDHPADVVDVELEDIVKILVHAVVDLADETGDIGRRIFLPAGSKRTTRTLSEIEYIVLEVSLLLL